MAAALAAARRTIWVAPKRVRRSLRDADKDRSWLVVRDSVFAQQGGQRSRQVASNGDDAISAPLAVQQHLWMLPF